MNRIVRSFVRAFSQALYIRRTTEGGIDTQRAKGRGQRAKGRAEGRGQRAKGKGRGPRSAPLPSALCPLPCVLEPRDADQGGGAEGARGHSRRGGSRGGRRR